MLRRVVTATNVSQRRALGQPLALTHRQTELMQVQSRTYVGPVSLVLSCITCSFVVTMFACNAQNLMNVSKFGLFRFKNHGDDSIMPVDYKQARWVGGMFGFVYYWFFVGPNKYEKSDMEKWQPRFGPF
jgi:hypothetical protein